MNIDLKNLIELQDIDIRIIELERSKEEFPIIVNKLEKTISQAEETIKNIETELSEIKNEKKTAEERITNAKLSLDKSQKRLNTIKTNKEYDAVHAEIETHKHIVASADKSLQKYSNDNEILEARLNEAQNAYDQITTENKPQIKELKAKIATIDSTIEEVGSERDGLVPTIQKQYMRAYDHVRSRRKKGKALSIVNRIDRNCTVCYQLLQPQVINQIRKGVDIIYCRSCGSLLIWKENVVENEEE